MFKFIIAIILLISFLNAKVIRGIGNEEIVIDTKTGLIWIDNEIGTKTWKEAIDYCDNLDIGIYDNWRMPNYNELKSLVDYTKSENAMLDNFNHQTGALYWTSTIRADKVNNNLSYTPVWTIDFSNGHDNYRGYSTSEYSEKLSIRCVHNRIHY